ARIAGRKRGSGLPHRNPQHHCAQERPPIDAARDPSYERRRQAYNGSARTDQQSGSADGDVKVRGQFRQHPDWGEYAETDHKVAQRQCNEGKSALHHFCLSIVGIGPTDTAVIRASIPARRGRRSLVHQVTASTRGLRPHKLGFSEFLGDFNHHAAQDFILDLQRGLDEGDPVLRGHEPRERRAAGGGPAIIDAFVKFRDVAIEHFGNFQQPAGANS
ncbi:hypothetical protein KXV85_002430, partial [Aspergillus fumigatus]